MFNPCVCWNLKDGCVTVGIWSLVYALGQLGMFGWQTAMLNDCRSYELVAVNRLCREQCPCVNSYEVYCIAQLGIFGWQTVQIKWYKERAANNLLPPQLGSYETYDMRYPGYYERYYESPEERFYTGLFVVQILNLISAFFLLFASAALICGIHINSKYLVWPWFPCIVTSMLCAMAYSIMWWVGNVTSYWLVLSIIEVITVIINAYCLLCVLIQYRRIVNGKVDGGDRQEYYQQNQEFHKPTAVYYDNGVQGGSITTKPLPDGSWGGEYNQGYSPEQNKYFPPVSIHQNQPAEELPVKLVPPSDPQYNYPPDAHGANPEPDPNVQWWLNTVNPNEPPPINASFEEGVLNLPRVTPTALQPPPVPLRPSKSVPDIIHDDNKSRKHRHGRHRSGRRHRSSSVGSRSHKSSRDTSSPGSDSDRDDRTSSRHRRHRSQSRDRSYYDSDDTGFSQSDCSRSHRRRRRERGERSEKKERKHKRVRDVKREDKERRDPPSPNPPPPTATPTQPSWPPNSQSSQFAPGQSYPGQQGQGGITIPQHIIIPPTKKGASGQPQRFHINSEITISYSDRSTPNPSDSEAIMRRDPRWAPLDASRPTIRPVDSGSAAETENHRASFEGSAHGSTAV